MRFPRRAVARASLRLFWTLLITVFSAHHTAPNAPIWHSSSQHCSSHSAQHNHSIELVFTAPHADHQSHCELCFTSAFAPPAILNSVPRVALVNPKAASALLSLGFASDQRLPEAHAPPEV